MRKCQDIPHLFFVAGERSHRFAGPVAASILSLFWLMAFITITGQPAHGQTYQVIHNFTNRGDGAYPSAGLTVGPRGAFYGTAAGGGSGFGTVFEVRGSGSHWTLLPIYTFAGGTDGAVPMGRVLQGPEGRLYGTTTEGGELDSGTVFSLALPPTASTSARENWSENVLYRFHSSNDGRLPQGDLTFDQAGNIYGTTIDGGAGCGMVYELTPSMGSWTETNLTPDCLDGVQAPFGGGVFDRAGNLYGVYNVAAPGAGAVYELSPSGSSWTEQLIHIFTGNDGGGPEAGLIIDAAGNLYGSTIAGGIGGGGTVFEMSPSAGGWGFNLLYSFSGEGAPWGPLEKLMMDGAGNLYGTTYIDGAYGQGAVFELTPTPTGWTYTSLHDFTGGADGAYPYSGLVFDSEGNLYGTAANGGTGRGCGQNGCGVVFRITPH